MATINHPLPRGSRRPLPGRLPRLFPRFPAPNWWVLSSVAVLGIGAMLPVIQNSAATTRGFETQALQVERARIQGDIRVLESDVATLTSLDRVRQRAAELGLGPATSPIFVEVDEAGPAPAKIPAEHLPAPTSPRGEGESWWRSLIGWLPLLPG
ncbi:MAG: hypothetical protein ACSLFM_00060 [Tepidiformaceae bacterium]